MRDTKESGVRPCTVLGRDIDGGSPANNPKDCGRLEAGSEARQNPVASSKSGTTLPFRNWAALSKRSNEN